MVGSPPLVLADEPIASLDPRNTQVVMDALQHINRHLGITVICNLHSLDLARSYCDRLVGMSGGRVVFDGVPAALTDATARDLYGLEAGDVVGAGGIVAADQAVVVDVAVLRAVLLQRVGGLVAGDVAGRAGVGQRGHVGAAQGVKVKAAKEQGQGN